MERRSFATTRNLWPEAEVIHASEPPESDARLMIIGDDRLVVDQLVGGLQRVIGYPKLGFAIEHHVPRDVLAAYGSLIDHGFTGRLLEL